MPNERIKILKEANYKGVDSFTFSVNEILSKIDESNLSRLDFLSDNEGRLIAIIRYYRDDFLQKTLTMLSMEKANGKDHINFRDIPDDVYKKLIDRKFMIEDGFSEYNASRLYRVMWDESTNFEAPEF